MTVTINMKSYKTISRYYTHYKCVKSGVLSGRLKMIRIPLIILSLTIFLATSLWAQEGFVVGQVLNAKTDHPLANITISSDSGGTYSKTDQDGRFVLRGLTAGEHELVVIAPGYVNQQFPITVGEQNTNQISILLQPDFEEGDRLFVEAKEREQASILSRKKSQMSYSAVMGKHEMTRFEDHSVADMLIRLPGVQSDRRKGLNIRGVGPNMYRVAIDGQPIAGSRPASRGFDLGVFSSDLAQDIEIIKITTPDMDAEGIGGIVNVNTWQPVGERELNVRAGGVAETGIFKYTGLGNVASIQYSERYRDDFSMALNLSWQNDNRGFEHLGLDYASADFGDGPVDVIERVSPGITLDDRSRINAQLQMNYQPTARSSFYARSVIASDERTRDRHRNISRAGGDWINQSETGLAGEQGSFGYDALMQTSADRYYLVQTGGRHLLDFIHVDYRLGWSRSDINQHQYYFPFLRERLNFDIDMNDRTRPKMTINNWRLLEDGTLDRRQLSFDPAEKIKNELLEDRYSGRFDIEVPHSFGYLKAGGSAILTRSDRGYEETGMRPIRNFDMMRFDAIPRGQITVMDHYYIPWLINTDNARTYLNTNLPIMRIDDDNTLNRSEYANFYMKEDIYAGYGMFKFEYGPVGVQGGARVEHTAADYEGRNVTFSRFGSFESSQRVVESVSYTDLFPHVQLFVTPMDGARLRLAWTRNIYRQDYGQLAPFIHSQASDTSRWMGNANLKPMYSDNLDLVYEHNWSHTGAMSIGLFYREFGNGVIIEQRVVEDSNFPHLDISEGESVTVTESQYQNSTDKAKVYGLEVSLQQRLRFLPGYLGGLGLYANYTWSHSEQENVRNGNEMQLLYQSPHVVNAALDYTHGRFVGQVAWHWTAPALHEVAREQAMAPSLNPLQPVYRDQFIDGWKDLSASVGYRLSDNFRVWAAVENLMKSDRKIYGEDREFYPLEMDYKTGIRLTTGLRFTL